MPKLVIKNNLPPPSAPDRLAQFFYTTLPVILISIAVIGGSAFYFLHNPANTAASTAINDVTLPQAYRKQLALLEQRDAAFTTLASQGLEDYQRNNALMQQATAILTQLNDMDGLVRNLGLSEAEQQNFLSRHQYLKDYWESKRVFHALRLGRFKVKADDAQVTSVPEIKPAATQINPAPEGKLINTQAVAPQTDAAADKTAVSDGKHYQFAQPPADVKLPDGFCPLFGPDAGSCKKDEPVPESATTTH